MDVAAHLAESAARVDAYLDARLPPADEPPAALHAAMRHLVFPGGKRLRPALAFAACQAAGGPAEAALPAAAAVELIHTYSLVHDDLPCMDDDDERRGRPTVHRVYGEAVAVLAGDALQAEAFAVLADAAPDAVRGAGPAAEGFARAALAELAAAAGSRALVGGQADDLVYAPEGDAALEALESIHRRKSAALIRAAVVCGGMAGGLAPGDHRLAALGRFGEAAGLGFQIADDRLDRAADAESAEASSYVTLAGDAAARARAEALLRTALAEIEDWGERAEPLRELARFSVWRNQ